MGCNLDEGVNSSADVFDGKLQEFAGQRRLHRARHQPDGRQRGSFAGRAIGAAWSKRSNEGRDYLSVKLGDPRFTVPIYTNLVEDGAASRSATEVVRQ